MARGCSAWPQAKIFPCGLTTRLISTNFYLLKLIENRILELPAKRNAFPCPVSVHCELMCATLYAFQTLSRPDLKAIDHKYRETADSYKIRRTFFENYQKVLSRFVFFDKSTSSKYAYMVVAPLFYIMKRYPTSATSYTPTRWNTAFKFCVIADGPFFRRGNIKINLDGL